MSNYGINDIETLSFKDGVRQRIAMYLGSADMQGVYNAIQEIISNSIDEYYMGYGNKIDISLDNNRITITDEGRGIPFGIKEDGSNVLIDIFSKAHTGGKFNNKVYQSVAGLNGIGAKATCLSSLNFKVNVFRPDIKKRAYAEWEKGILKDYIEYDYEGTTRGTGIQFELDPEVYNLEPINIDFEHLCNQCKSLSYLTKGLKFHLVNINEHKIVDYCAENGLLDLIKDNVKNPLHKTPIYLEVKEGNLSCEIALQWTKEKEKSFVFTNGLLNSEGGTSLTGVKTAITNFMKKQFHGEFDGDMARTGLVYAVNCKIPNPSFANQTKTKINNPELRGLAQRTTNTALNDFVSHNSLEFKELVDYMTKVKKAEAAAARTLKQVMATVEDVEKAQKQKVFDVDKLSDARKLGEDSILLLVEGKSAGGAMQRVRDIDKFGILKLRGKIINALTHDLEEIMQNEEVRLFLKATGINIHNYKASKLRYGKVAICVDADDDGMHIACLIITLLYKLAPDYLREGRLCWLHAPLFKVQKGKETHYYYTEEQLAEGIKGKQTRFKGLGEMKDEDAKSMFGPEQWLETLSWDESAAMDIELLMGKDSTPRKEFIFNNIDFEKYGEV